MRQMSIERGVDTKFRDFALRISKSVPVRLRDAILYSKPEDIEELIEVGTRIERDVEKEQSEKKASKFKVKAVNVNDEEEAEQPDKLNMVFDWMKQMQLERERRQNNYQNNGFRGRGGFRGNGRGFGNRGYNRGGFNPAFK